MLSLKNSHPHWSFACFFLLCCSPLCTLSLHLSAPPGSLSRCNPPLWWVAYGADVISFSRELLWLCVRTLNNPSLLFHSPLYSTVNHPPCHHPIGSIRAPPPCPTHQKTTVHISIDTACGWKGEWHPPVYNSWDALSLLPHYSRRRKQIVWTMRLNWCIYVPNWL